MSSKIKIPENCYFMDSKRLVIKGFNKHNLFHIYEIIGNEMDKNTNHTIGRHTFFIEIEPKDISDQYSNIKRLLDNLRSINSPKIRVIFLTKGNKTYKDFAHIFDSEYKYMRIQGVRPERADKTIDISSKEYCILIRNLQYQITMEKYKSQTRKSILNAVYGVGKTITTDVTGKVITTNGTK